MKFLSSTNEEVFLIFVNLTDEIILILKSNYLKGIKKCENKIVRNKLVRIVSQIFYISAELISVNRGVWLGSVEFISAISEFLR